MVWRNRDAAFRAFLRQVGTRQKFLEAVAVTRYS
jgi:hypothetical protein